jgi:RimJ/RimL family protein N-acetyltransferase
LVLRRLTVDDLDLLARENPGAGQVSEAARRWVEASHGIDPRDGGAWAMVHRIRRQTVGAVMYFAVQPGAAREISYVTAARWRRRGLGGEAVAAVLTHLFDEVGLQEVSADVAIDNDASIGLLQKFGFTPSPIPAPGLTVGLDRQVAARWGLDARTWSDVRGRQVSPSREDLPCPTPSGAGLP